MNDRYPDEHKEDYMLKPEDLREGMVFGWTYQIKYSLIIENVYPTVIEYTIRLEEEYGSNCYIPLYVDATSFINTYGDCLMTEVSSRCGIPVPICSGCLAQDSLSKDGFCYQCTVKSVTELSKAQNMLTDMVAEGARQATKKCTCSIQSLMQGGCSCGGS